MNGEAAGIAPYADRAFRPDVEGLRAIAVGMVVLDHAGVGPLAGGYVGVDVFFVLSGFLITGLLLREHDQRHAISILGFYARRARRILPAATVVLVATVVVAVILFGGTRAARAAEDARSAALFVSNFRFIQQGTDYWSSDLPPSPVQHFWSLSIEEQFYFIWPSIVMATALVARRVPLRTKLTLVLVVGIIATLAVSSIETAHNATAAYFSPLSRAWELAFGALLAVLAPRLVRLPVPLGGVMSVVGLGAILGAGLLFNDRTPFPGYAALLPVGGAALAIAGGTAAPGSGAEVVLRFSPFQWVGRLSYSLYLWHWPVLIFLPEILGQQQLTLLQGLGGSALALGLAASTFQVIEHPARTSPWLRARPAVVSVGAGACLVLLSVVVASGLRAVLPVRPGTEGVQPDTNMSAQPPIGSLSQGGEG